MNEPVVKPSPRLAAVVITKNEQANIDRCLSSLRFCDEIVLVDAESTDATVEKARRYTDKTFVRAWKGYADQRNWGAATTTCEWVFSVDADEEVTESLAREIRAKIQTAATAGVTAFTVPRKTLHHGRWIRHGGWYPNRLVRLFDRSRGEWVGNEIHERWETSGKMGELANDLVHYSFVDIADQVSRNNRYSSLGAQKLAREGKRFSPVKLCLKTASKFFETYFLKRGFLDGYPGFIIAVSAAYSVFLKWAKLWELEAHEEKIG